MVDREGIRRFVYIFLAISAVTIIMYFVLNRIPYTRELQEKIFHFRPSNSKSIEI